MACLRAICRFGFRACRGSVTPVLILLAGCEPYSADELTVQDDEQALALGMAPIADAYVQSGSYADKNFGGASSVSMDQNASGTVKQGFLRFNVGPVGEIQSARLSLYVVNGSSDAANLVKVSATTWGESSITWNNKPAIDGAVVASIGAASSGAIVEVDLTGAVKENSILSLAVVARSGDGFAFASKESSNSPRLVIQAATTDAGTPSNTPDTGGSDATSVVSTATEIDSPCLNASTIIKVSDPPDGTLLEIQAKKATYDMRGVGVLAVPETHLVDFEYPTDICVTGVAAIAKYPSGFVVNWENVKEGDGNHGPYDEGGLHVSYPRSGTAVFDRVYVEGVEDGLMIAREAGDSTQRWELNDAYMKNVIDDTIENDGYRSGKVTDILAEGVHMFYSARNDVELPHSVLIDNSVIGFGCKADDRTDTYSGAGSCPKGTSTQRMFKLSSLHPKITIQNTIIYHPAVSRSGPKSTCLPSDGTYNNVTVVWGAGISYPCSGLSGVKVTTDVNVYKNARANWLARHGCNSDGTGCAFLRR